MSNPPARVSDSQVLQRSLGFNDGFWQHWFPTLRLMPPASSVRRLCQGVFGSPPDKSNPNGPSLFDGALLSTNQKTSRPTSAHEKCQEDGADRTLQPKPANTAARKQSAPSSWHCEPDPGDARMLVPATKHRLPGKVSHEFQNSFPTRLQPQGARHGWRSEPADSAVPPDETSVYQSFIERFKCSINSCRARKMRLRTVPSGMSRIAAISS